MRRRSLVVWSVVVLILVAIFAIAFEQGRVSAVLYRLTSHPRWFYAALHKGIVCGDSIEKVQRLLGPCSVRSEPDEVIAKVRMLIAKYPERHPDGVQDNDVFLAYRFGKRATAYLQFRNGCLINFNPEDFAEYKPSFVIKPSP